MQRLARLSLVPQRRALTLQVKETGTQVDFSKSKEVSLGQFIFQDEILGVYAYQAMPATVDAATRNAFFNGNLNDLQTFLTANGFQLQYARISWNETAQGSSYYITDLVVGVIATAVFTTDTTANKVLAALSYISWYKNLISKVSMPWKAWVLVPQPATQPLIRWEWDAISAPFQLSSLSGTPSPPAVDETRTHFINDGQVDGALGEFVRSMLDSGYQVTLFGYQVRIGYETTRTWQHQDRTYAEYRTHTRLSVDYNSNPPPDIEGLGRRGLITPALVLAIGKAIAYIILALLVGAGIFFALNNLTTQKTTNYGWTLDPNTGEWEWKPISETTGPPDWWGSVIPTVILGGLIIVGAVVVLPPIIKSFRGKE